MSTALLTGASSGIGLSMARQLAKQGWHLILVARRTDRLTQLKAELEAAHHISVHLIPQDLSAPDAAQQLFEAARPWQVDALINNAGSGMQGRFLDMDPAALDQMLRLNVHSLTHLTRLFAREMQGRDGYILNVASAAAFLPSPWVSSYAATKAYVRSFSEALRYELRSTGVSVTTLYPGITRTEFNEVAHAKTPRLMDMSILDADTVARIGLAGMFARRREVIPGWINWINAQLSLWLPPGLITWSAGRLLGQANGWER